MLREREREIETAQRRFAQLISVAVAVVVVVHKCICCLLKFAASTVTPPRQCSPSLFNCCRRPTQRWTQKAAAPKKRPPLGTARRRVRARFDSVGTWKRHQSKSWQRICLLSASSSRQLGAGSASLPHSLYVQRMQATQLPSPTHTHTYLKCLVSAPCGNSYISCSAPANDSSSSELSSCFSTQPNNGKNLPSLAKPNAALQKVCVRVWA